jgi:hypothetical protein
MKSFDFPTISNFKSTSKNHVLKIETMCNEIIRNYTKKEKDCKLMTAAFGTRPKRRSNRLMDALNFEYPYYDRLDEGAKVGKRKRIVSILGRQAARSVKEVHNASKKQKTLPESKDSALEKQNLDRISSADMKVRDVPEKTMSPPSPSTAEVSEILKVMTESIPFALLSPLRLDLTSLLQSKETAPAAEERSRGQKKQ